MLNTWNSKQQKLRSSGLNPNPTEERKIMSEERDYYAEVREVLEYWIESGMDKETIENEVAEIIQNLELEE